jgi:hypothetical protein
MTRHEKRNICMINKEILIVYKGHHCKLMGHIVDLPDKAVIYADENEIAPWLVQDLEREKPCAFCDGAAKLRLEPITVNHKSENHVIDQWFYECQKCNQEFETTESMAESLKPIQ